MMRNLLASAAILLATTASALAQQKPNIVVIMGDDLRWQICELGMTEVCERIQAGREYTRAYTSFSVCAPSRTSFLTGQNPPQHGVLGDNEELLSPDGLMPKQLQLAGYTTGIFGKDPQGISFSMGEIGFNQWGVMSPHKGGDSDKDDRYFDAVFNTPAGNVQMKGYTPTKIYQQCIDFIETAPQPFFVWCADIAPHAPNTPKPENIGKCKDLPFPVAGWPNFNEEDIGDKPDWFDPPAMDERKEKKQAKKWRTTCETLKETSKFAGRIIKMAGPNTVVFFTSDHGLAYGEHRVTGKLTLFEEAARIPLIVWGGPFAPGRDERYVSTVDLTATILALAGAKPGLPPPPDAGDIRTSKRDSVHVWARWGENEMQPGPTGLSMGTFNVDGTRIFEHVGGGGTEVYDLNTDPYQVK